MLTRSAFYPVGVTAQSLKLLGRSLVDQLRPRIAHRLLVLVVAVVLVCGGLVGGMVIARSEAMLREVILSNNLAAAEMLAQQAYRYMEGAQLGLLELARRPNIVHAVLDDEPERVTPDLVHFLAHHSRFDSVSLYDTDAISRASGVIDNQAIGTSVADREWFQQTVATGRPYIGIPVVSRVSGFPVTPFAIPINDTQGVLRGVLVGGISLHTLTEMVVNVSPGTAARAALVDTRGNGIILAHVDRSRIMQPTSGSNAAVRRVLVGERGYMENTSSAGEATLAAFAPVAVLPWGVLIQQPSQVAFAPVKELERDTLALVGGVLAVGSAVSLWLALRLSRPLQQLHRAARAFASGDLTRRVRFHQQDEIGDLGRAFDQMAIARQHADEALRALNESLERRVSERTAELQVTVGQLEEQIREREQVERALRAANAELEQFAYTVSHDLKAPLVSILGFSNELKLSHAAALDDLGRRYLDRIEANAGRLNDLIADVLAFSRVGRVGAPAMSVDLGRPVRQVLEQQARLIEQSGATVRIQEPLPAVIASPTLLEQIVSNLIANALTYGVETGEAPHVEVGCEDLGERWRLFVQDHGPGIPPEHQERLFKLFERLSAGKAVNPSGTGIGLSIVRKAARAMGGEAGVESASGRGARFWVEFPKVPESVTERAPILLPSARTSPT